MCPRDTLASKIIYPLCVVFLCHGNFLYHTFAVILLALCCTDYEFFHGE